MLPINQVHFLWLVIGEQNNRVFRRQEEDPSDVCSIVRFFVFCFWLQFRRSFVIILSAHFVGWWGGTSLPPSINCLQIVNS